MANNRQMTQEELEQKRLELMERQLAVQERQAAAMLTQVERTAPRENPNYKAAGPFTAPDGEEWSAKLPYPIYDGPVLLNRTPLTADDVAQLSRLQPLEHGQIVKADRSTVKARVVPKMDATGKKIVSLAIERPMGKDDSPQLYPPIDEVARQLADQAEAVAV